MRITTNAILRNYKSNLGASLSNLDTARNRVMTGRQYLKSSENPANALRAANLERRYLRNEDYLDSVKDAQSFQDAQEDAAMQINKLAITMSKQYGLEALNATNQSTEVLKTYADAWRGTQQSILLSLNASYEGKYVFAGGDGMTPPFTFDPDTNVLKYRGLDVNDPANKDMLDELSKETVYIDLGFGLNIEHATNEIDSASAFNTSLPGINLIGYGQSEDGLDTNMLTLAGQIADALEKEPFDNKEYEKLLHAFDSGRSRVLEQVTTLGTQTEFLTNTKTRLETSELSLTQQLDRVVNVDMAEAITQFSWAQYAYNAALKVGTEILSPSFIDFMK